MGSSLSSQPDPWSQVQRAEAAAFRATQSAQQAQSALLQAREAWQCAEEASMQLQEAMSQAESADAAQRSWWRRAGSTVEKMRHRMHTEVALKQAEAKVALATASAEEYAVREKAAESACAAAEARERACRETLTSVQARLQEAESKIKRQEFMWFVALLAGLAAGALLGGLLGAAATAMPSKHVDSAKSRAASEVGVVSALADLTFQIFSLPNILAIVGGLTLTGVYIWWLVGFWSHLLNTSAEHQILSASCSTVVLSITYGAILVFMGDRSWSRGDDGSRILGGMFYCGCALVAPVVTAAGLRMLGWRWMADARMLGSSSRRSLVDFERAGPSPAILIIAMAGMATAVTLYVHSGFPILLAPMLSCAYIAFVATAMMLYRILRVPKFASALLQPELLATLAFGTLAFLGCSIDIVVPSMPMTIRLAALIAGMNALLMALPAVLLGMLDRSFPNRAGLARASMYDLFSCGEKCLDLVATVRGTPAFAVVAGVYIVVWVTVMTTALRLRLWTCRPFVLLSLNALCASSPYGSIGWTLAFRIPIGLWLLAVVVYVETGGYGSDPILQEVLRWLGPHPAPFLELLHATLQAGTASTAMICFGSGLICAKQQFGELSWVPSLISWGFAVLALAARLDCDGAFLSFCFASWALAFFFIGTRLLPDWHKTHTRLITFFVAGRLCLLSRGSLLLSSASSAIVCFLCATCTFGESDVMRGTRRFFLHDDDGNAGQVSSLLWLMACFLLFLHGVANDEAVLVTLGAFCIYTSLASAVAGDRVSGVMVIALCGLATMLLGEAAQAYMVPLQLHLSALAKHSPLCHVLFEKSALDGLPCDLYILRDFVREMITLVSGKQEQYQDIT